MHAVFRPTLTKLYWILVNPENCYPAMTVDKKQRHNKKVTDNIDKCTFDSGYIHTG